MSEPIHVGIDVAKDTLEVAFGPQRATQSFANNDDGHEALFVPGSDAHNQDVGIMRASPLGAAPATGAPDGSETIPDTLALTS